MCSQSSTQTTNRRFLSCHKSYEQSSIDLRAATSTPAQNEIELVLCRVFRSDTVLWGYRGKGIALALSTWKVVKNSVKQLGRDSKRE